MRREGDARGDYCLDGNLEESINCHAPLPLVEQPRRSEETSLSFLQIAFSGGDIGSKGVG